MFKLKKVAAPAALLIATVALGGCYYQPSAPYPYVAPAYATPAYAAPAYEAPAYGYAAPGYYAQPYLYAPYDGGVSLSFGGGGRRHW